MSLKICSVSPYGDTGMAYYDYSFCQALSEAGVAVTLFTTQRWLLAHRERKFKVENHFFGVYETVEPSQRLPNYLAGLAKIFSYVLKEKVQIVHFQSFAFPTVDALFLMWLKLWRIKIVYSPHDIAALKANTGIEVIGHLLDLADVLVVHSVANKVFLIKEFDIEHDRIRVIQQGNYNAFLNPGLTKSQAQEKIGLPQDKKLILLFGHLRKDKGIATAVKALALLPDQDTAVLVIVGKPHPAFDMDSLRRDISVPQLKDRVILKDQWIEDSLAELYYKSADVVLLPYDASYTSAVLVYAFSCGAATVVSNIYELTEFVVEGDNALIFHAGEPADLAQKLRQLITNPVLAQRIARSAKHVADNEWKWEATAAVQKKIYKELFSNYFPKAG
ncbi:MAG: hypothetical protein A3D10_09525 [Omnitrophica WOR_2 bacterium RIFCSPHIGHO2_02_FULL_48_11]|nr:MAG: hypothetical protein A3D10_09525 [Omnitrophica WOR_2 bacterium RIFCSPHIGHO2_02_FULL_48_11]